ncbi:MAG: glycosyltransferase family 2 protein [Thiotrichaceae bacterium]|nr:glycosyltransferase family 2 protein [Thiotrichaceae bacterium]
MKEKSISFIIPHKGREVFLQKTIESITLQEIDLSLIEVIIVTQNDGLTNETLRFQKNITLSIYTRTVTDTISSLRNYGVEKAKGEYLAFLDADVFLSANWAQSMLNTLKEVKSRVITSAVQINGKDAPPLEKIRTALSNAITDHNVSFLPGRNLFLSRETFYKAGGFPAHLISCEDYYFTDKANQLGDLYYTSKASYIHLGEDKDFKEMYTKEIWRGQSNLLSIKGRSIPLNEIPSFIIPIAFLILFLIMLVTLISGKYIFAIFSFIAMLLPVTLYSTRLYILARNKVKFHNVVKFYLYYFPARAIGTIGGLFKTFNTKSLH